MPNISPLTQAMYWALEVEIGLVVRSSDPKRFRERFYAERRKDPLFKTLSLVTSPDGGGQFWIIRTKEFEDVGTPPETHS